MAVPNAGDILSYNGSQWVNQPGVQASFWVGGTTPPAPGTATFTIQGQGGGKQLLVEGSASQGDSIFVLQRSDLNNVMTVGNAGQTGLTYVDGSNSLAYPLRINRQTTIAPGAGLGLGIQFYGWNTGSAFEELVDFIVTQTAFGANACSGYLAIQTKSAGTAGERMRITETGNVGIGTTSPGSLLQVNGAIATTVANKTAAYTLTASDSVVTADATGGAFTVTLPTAVGVTGRAYTVKKTDASANAVTVGTTASQTIDGAGTYALSARYQFVRVVSDGSNWQIVAK